MAMTGRARLRRARLLSSAARLTCRARCAQAALEAGRTELAISLPPGMRFGLFGDPGKQVIGTPGAEPTARRASAAGS